MEERPAGNPRTLNGKSTIFFFLSLFLRAFIVILCPVLLVFTFEKNLIMTGQWALNFYQYLIAGSTTVIGGSLLFSTICLFVAPYSSIVIRSREVKVIKRFSQKEIAFSLPAKDSASKDSGTAVIPVKRKRSFLGNSLLLENSDIKVVLWEVSFPSPVWNELNIYLLGYASLESSRAAASKKGEN